MVARKKSSSSRETTAQAIAEIFVEEVQGLAEQLNLEPF